MSTTTNETNVQSSAVPAPATKQTDYKNLVTGQDFRPQANDVTMPPQPAVRAEENDAQGA